MYSWVKASKCAHLFFSWCPTSVSFLVIPFWFDHCIDYFNNGLPLSSAKCVSLASRLHNGGILRYDEPEKSSDKEVIFRMCFLSHISTRAKDWLCMQVCVTVGIGLLAAFLFGLRLRGIASPKLLAFLLAAWASSVPISFLVQWSLPLAPLPQEAQRLFPDSKFLVEEARKQSNRFESTHVPALCKH